MGGGGGGGGILSRGMSWFLEIIDVYLMYTLAAIFYIIQSKYGIKVLFMNSNKQVIFMQWLELII